MLDLFPNNFKNWMNLHFFLFFFSFFKNVSIQKNYLIFFGKENISSTT